MSSTGRRDDDWTSSSYQSGGNHVPFDDEIRSPVAGYPPQYPAYQLNQQAPYAYSQMPSDHTRNVAFPTAYTQSPQTQMGPPVERATNRAKETHPYTRYSGTPQTMAYTAEPVPMPAEEVKKKRKRADAAQLKVLNATYQRTAFPSTEERQSLANELGMPPRSVQIWYVPNFLYFGFDSLTTAIFAGSKIGGSRIVRPAAKTLQLQHRLLNRVTMTPLSKTDHECLLAGVIAV